MTKFFTYAHDVIIVYGSRTVTAYLRKAFRLGLQMFIPVVAMRFQLDSFIVRSVTWPV